MTNDHGGKRNGAGRPKAPPGSQRHNVILPPDVWAGLGENKSAEIERLWRAYGMKEYQHYYAWAGNGTGAILDIGHDRSINALCKRARNQLGSGWQVHVMRVEINGERTEVKTFKIR